jgi:cell wall-associated NlpC family hydrolase
MMRRNRVLACVLAISFVVGTTPAFAKSPKPTLAQIQAAKNAEAAKRAAANAAAAKLAQANQTLHQLTAAADSARARYVRAQQQLAVAVKISHIAALHAQITSAAVTSAHRTIGKLATNAYIMGGGLTDIEPLLSSNGPQDLVDRLTTLSTIGAHNSTALDRYKSAQVVAAGAKREADTAKVAQQAAANEVASAKKIADDAKSAQQSEVDKLQKVQDELMREFASAKRVRVTLEQQRQLALLEEANAKKAAHTPGQKSIWDDRGFKGRASFISTAKQRAAAVAYAKKQVLAHKPYVWGAQGPNAFDCSGLVYAAYKSAGLGWPYWSRLNAALYSVAKMHVKLTDLIPGDFLFYSYDGTVGSIHHMSIYAGDGMMWEANSTRYGLLYSSIYSVKGMMPFGGRV